MQIELDSSSSVAIISHVDLDGVGAAFVVQQGVKELAKGQGLKIDEFFIGYSSGIGSRIVESVNGQFYDYVFITDMSLRNNAGGTQDLDLVVDVIKKNPKTKFFYWDHHSSTQAELFPELDNLVWKVERDIDANMCGTDIAYEELWVKNNLEETAPSLIGYHVRRMVALANDYDLWHKKINDSTDFSDAISVLGPRKVYESLVTDIRLVYDYKGNEFLWGAVERARKDRALSLQLVKDTCTEVSVGGQRVRVGVCNGYSSEAGHVLADGDVDVVAIALDLRHDARSGFKPSLSLRRAEGSQVNLRKVAEKLGGGGHEYAAGGHMPAVRLIQAMLSETVSYVQEQLDTGV